MNEMNAKKIIENFSDLCNVGQFRKNEVINAIVNEFTSQHRYLQSEMFMVLVKFIEALAKKDLVKFTDDRNQWAYEWARKAIAAIYPK